jgi:Uma2 family endonuclease
MAAVTAYQMPLEINETSSGLRRDAGSARRQFNVAEYYRMAEVGILGPDERVELINGEVRVMSPQGPNHASSGSRADRWFIQNLGDRALIRIQRPIHLSDDTEPEPDLVVAIFDEEEYAEHHPLPAEILLVLEVSVEKGLLYAQAGIIQYCILNTEAREVEDYRDPSADGYRSKATYIAGQSFNLAAFPDVFVGVSEILPPIKKPVK